MTYCTKRGRRVHGEGVSSLTVMNFNHEHVSFIPAPDDNRLRSIPRGTRYTVDASFEKHTLLHLHVGGVTWKNGSRLKMPRI